MVSAKTKIWPPSWKRPILLAIPAVGLAFAFAFIAAGRSEPARLIWTIATIPVLLALCVDIVSNLRRGAIGLDVLAALSMSGALILSEPLAANVVALMYAGGQYLEGFAEGRALREMTALLERAPRTAARYADGRIEEVALDAIGLGDRLLIRRGDIVPVDGVIVGGTAVLDEAALTGEAMPVKRIAGQSVMSGAANIGDVFDLAATRVAAESTYAGILRLVAAAQQSKAPMVRLADGFAVVFLVVAVALAFGAWTWSEDPVRALAVLVVATPCPLILAAPIAIISGVSRAAKVGVLIKGGKALEGLSQAKTLIIDKTGTLTRGEAEIVDIRPAPGFSSYDLLRLAASLDQASEHSVAKAIVAEATRQGISLVIPTKIAETPGDGIEGVVDGHAIMVGGRGFIARRLGLAALDAVNSSFQHAGAVAAAVGCDGKFAGELILADALRDDAVAFLAGLSDLGFRRIILATGDRREVAESIAKGLPFHAIHAELSPDEKIAIVQDESIRAPVMMIGDGINDAPALAAADVGVAMGVGGSEASAEVADVVLLTDKLGRVAQAVRIAQRSRSIALQSVFVGIGLSCAGMAAAAAGYLAPVQGALFQEAIDIAVILNALRALHE